MTQIELDAAVFNKSYYPHLHNYARTQIFYGGASSGKSVFVVGQRTVYDLLAGGRNYLICRKYGIDSRYSTFVEVNKVIEAWGVGHLFTVNKTLLTITCVNGYQIIFKGLDDLEKVKSITPQKGAITDIVIEEATQASKKDINQLRKRQRGGDETIPKRLTLLFNPIVKTHHIYDDYFMPNHWADNQTEFTSDELTILKTWYVHNQFLTTGDIYDLENEGDEYSRNVYTFGNWGVLGNTIFKNWRVEDLTAVKERAANRRYGLDFGFGVDPAAFNGTHYDKGKKTLYILDEFQGLELSNQNLATIIKPIAGGDMVYCDSAEPKSIKELQGLGIRATGAKKGKGSIEHGIKWLQAQTIIIDESCVNTANEFSLYSWKKDKYGEPLPVPEDKNNHHIDEIRYQYEDMAEANTFSINKYA